MIMRVNQKYFFYNYIFNYNLDYFWDFGVEPLFYKNLLHLLARYKGHPLTGKR